MRLIALLSLMCLPQIAVAHPGHLADVAGHDHWVAGAAIGAAVLIGLWGALKGKGKAESQDEDAAETEAEEELA